MSVQSYEGRRSATRTHFEVFDEALEEGDEVLRFADVARDGLREQVLWQHCGCGEIRRCMREIRRGENAPGLLMNASSSAAASCRPSTSFAYSSWSFDASVCLILCVW